MNIRNIANIDMVLYREDQYVKEDLASCSKYNISCANSLDTLRDTQLNTFVLKNKGNIDLKPTSVNNASNTLIINEKRNEHIQKTTELDHHLDMMNTSSHHNKMLQEFQEFIGCDTSNSLYGDITNDQTKPIPIYVDAGIRYLSDKEKDEINIFRNLINQR